MVTSYAALSISAPPASLALDPFYRKYTDALGIPIVSSEKVPDDALLVARDIVNAMLAGRPDVRGAMVERGYRVAVMAQSEMQTDLPEHRDMRKPARDDPRLTPDERARYDEPGGIGGMTDRDYWNARARGMGGRLTSCAEENLLGYPGTRYFGEHILVHEFSHAIMSALQHVDPELHRQILDAYRDAMEAGRFAGHYAAVTAAEYWAEGTQWWFGSNYAWRDGDVRLRSAEDLAAYDPRLFEQLGRVYVGHRIPADVYHGRDLRPGRPRGRR
ncbi:MAG: glycoside hydrolase [Planctomycetes bacterium]|nr:glycoside hydrolase [Planctomycetota bacterium]